MLVLQNNPCTDKQEPYLSSKKFCRYFDDSYKINQMEEIQQLNVEMSSFFDFGERGKLGFFILDKTSENYSLVSYLNNFEIENYFLKAIGFLEQNSYQMLHGATFQIKKTELNGEYKVMTRTQITQSSFNSLSLPFVHFGLGKINNYVEDFQVSITRKVNASHQWNPIIPNS